MSRAERAPVRASLLWATLGAAGLALYLWPAFSGPPVLWSDSLRDLEWAREGIGLWKPPPPGDLHLAKPGYLLLLRAEMAFAPFLAEPRSVVLAQSLLLWLSITATAMFVARRFGTWAGAVLCLALLSFLRLRDASSAVMTEAPSAALLLPFAAAVLLRERTGRGSFLFSGAAAGLLFWVRPNLGAVAFGLAVIAASVRWRPLALVVVSFAAFVTAGWLATRPAAGEDPRRGIAYPLHAATAEYYWLPSLGEWPEAPSERERGEETLRRAGANWKAFLSRPGPDTGRELSWRAFHGIFSTEFYDARWSRTYRALDTLSRLLAPFLVAGSLALLLSFPFADRRLNLAGVFLPAALIAQNLALGSHPRYVLPFLPVVFLLAVLAVARLRTASVPRRLTPAAVFAGLAAGLFSLPALLDWEWGQVEASGVRIVQPIRRGRLPVREPASFHARIAAPLVPTTAQLEVRGPGGQLLYSSARDPARERPVISFALPQWLLDANRKADVDLHFAAGGEYGPVHFLLFPVIPPPWARLARREGSRDLSPATGIRFGSLDWWAHADGAPHARRAHRSEPPGR
ncbi:MAG: hypothetical protein ABR576_06650 [Thermoanaerobaculia bacterium]